MIRTMSQDANTPSIFSRIIQGEIPARFVYRDPEVVAFLDIAPQAYGHTLVVPVAQVDKWTDLPAATWAHLMAVAQEIGKAQVELFDAPRSGQMIVGFDVPHTHVHLFPAQSLATFMDEPISDPDPQLMDQAASRLRAALRGKLGNTLD